MKRTDHHLSDAGSGIASPRRRTLIKLAAAVASLPLAACGSSGHSEPDGLVLADARRDDIKRSASFDEGWRFNLGESNPQAAALGAFADQDWRLLDLPHDWSIEDLAGASDDGLATSQPSNLFVFEQPSLTDTAPARIGPFDKNLSPGDRATGRTVGGEGWYRKHFSFTPATDRRVEIRYDGVYQNADMWINGHHLGFHPYGYTAFSYDLTPYLLAGDNVIAVRVRNLGKNSRWYSGSGIYRHTQLTVTGPLRIPRFGVALTTEQISAGTATVGARVTVQNTSAAAASVSAQVVVFDESGARVAAASSPAQVVKPGASQEALLTLQIPGASLWSPDTPHLYTAVIQLLVDGAVKDQTLETFGVRTVTVSGSDGFILNGTALKLRGGNLHHDHGPLGAISLGDSEQWRLSTLKSGGFNAIRIAHNPPSPELLQAADRLGMIVLNEFVDMWDVAKNDADYHLYFADWWERDLESWVLAARNSPAVCIWSIANEIYDSAAAEPRGRQLMSKMRTLDTSRPVMQGGAQGMLFIYNGPTIADYTDFGDVHYELSYAAARQAAPGKAWLQSESFAATFYDNWKMVTENRYAIGDFVWTAWDHLGESGMNVPRLIERGSDSETSYLSTFSDFGKQAGGVWGPYPWFAAGCGDFDLIGQTAPQHLYRRAVWDASPIELAVARPVSGNRQQQAFAFGWFDELESWTWDVAEGTAMRVHVYTGGDQVDLYLNNQLMESLKLDESDKRIASFWVNYQTGTLRAVAFRNGAQIGSKELVTVGAPAAIRLSADKRSLSTSRDAMAYVLASVVDQQGRLVPDAVVRVSFAVAGGELAAVGSGNSHNVDSFHRGKRYSWHGKVMAYVRPPKKPGKMVLTASADGLASASLELTVL